MEDSVKILPLLVTFPFVFTQTLSSQYWWGNLSENVCACDTFGMECALALTDDTHVTSMTVVDFFILSMVGAGISYFVIGSLLIPVRAMLPVFALDTHEKADAFVNLCGGNVYAYTQLRELPRQVREKRGRQYLSHAFVRVEAGHKF